MPPTTLITLAEALSCGKPGCGCNRRFGSNLTGHCPAHDDAQPSFSIGEKEGKLVVHCNTGCSQAAVLAALRARGLFLSEKPIGDTAVTSTRKPKNNPRRRIAKTYDYTDEAGTLLFQAVRYEPKDFNQRRPAGNGTWIYSIEGIRRVLYRLPEVIAAVDAGKLVYFCEGEKDADAVAALGQTATCNPMGAEKWDDAYTETLCGANVVILPDNDKAGRNHARLVARSLHGKAGRVRIVELPGLPEKGDVSDWLAAGGTRAKLVEIVKATPDWKPEDDIAPEEDKPGSEAETKEENLTAAMRLVAIGREGTLFHSERDEPFVRFHAKGRENDSVEKTYRLRSKEFRGHLAFKYFSETGRAAGGQAIEDALRTLEGFALHEGQQYPLSVRTAFQDGAYYYDLVNADWQAVKVDAQGWEIVTVPTPLFRRYAPAAEQPLPARGGSLDCLRDFVNIRDTNAWYQLIAWLVAALIPDIPHPVLVVHGEQGTAKSTLLRLLVMLIDPSKTPLKTEPRDIGEWVQTADHCWLTGLDNVSHLPNWLSDALCRAVSGDGFLKRQLYTDGDDIILAFQRVIALTGIEVVAQRADLLDRSILLGLERIPDEKRLPESEVLREFAAVRPAIVGGLLDALVGTLRELPGVKMDRMPRMADFARVGVAVERALHWPEGAFLKAYDGNIAEQHQEALSSSVIGEALLAFMNKHLEWDGSAKELLEELGKDASDVVTRRKEWPKSARAIGGELRRIAPNLRAVKVEVEFKKTQSKRSITLTRQGGFSTVSTVSTVPTRSNGAEVGTVGDASEAAGDGRGTVEPLPIPSSSDGRDGQDDEIPSSSHCSLTADELAETEIMEEIEL